MRIAVLGGAGAMGMVTTRDLVDSPTVSEVILCDANEEKAKEVTQWMESNKLSVRRLDISDRKSLLDTIKDADAVANATPYHFNLVVTKAAIKARKNLTDLGGVYYMTLK